MWTEIQKMLISANPGIFLELKPKNKIRLVMFQLIKNKKFDLAIVGVIVVNMLSLAMKFDGTSATYMFALDMINLSCTAIFISEAIIKIVALGLNYFKSAWNRFDFFIALTSIAVIIITYALSTKIPYYAKVLS